MRKSFGILTVSLAAVAVSGSLTGCVVAPAQPAYYGYGGDYYAPAYGYYPGYVEPSIGIGFGFGGGDRDRDGWHGGGHGRGGWHDRH